MASPECESGAWAWIVLWAAEGAVVGHLLGGIPETMKISNMMISNLKRLVTSPQASPPPSPARACLDL